MIEVALSRVDRVSDPPNVRTNGCLKWEPEEAFDFVFHRIGQLRTARGKELDAVVRHRVMRRRQHDSECGIEFGGQERNSRCRENSYAQNVNPGTGQTSADRGFEEFATGTRIATDNSEWSLSCILRTKYPSRRNGQVKREWGSQDLVGQTANSVGTE